MKSTRVLEEYSQQKIEIIRRLLERQAEKGMPMPYEISVDNFKIVMKTTDLSEFDSYEELVNKETKFIRITTFENTSEDAAETKYVFELPDKKSEALVKIADKGLGEIEVSNKIKETLANEKERWDKELLVKELEKTKSLLAEAEDYSDKLQEQIDLMKTTPYQLGNMNLVGLGTTILEGVMRSNPQWVSKVPMLQGLAGVIQKENESGETKNIPAEDTEVSFKKSESTASTLNETDLRCLDLGKWIVTLFNKEETGLLIKIIGELGEDTSQLQTVADLLEVPQEEPGKN
jgi:hypothetical protein